MKDGLLFVKYGDATLIACMWRSKVGDRDVKKVAQALGLVQVVDVVVVTRRW